jgi:hypothetical protein
VIGHIRTSNELLGNSGEFRYVEKDEAVRRFPAPWTVEVLDGGFKVIELK